MAYYAIAPLLCALVQNELCMHLYINQVYGGPNPNQLVVISESQQPLSFGTTAVQDWTITDGPGPNANYVGRAQGFHFQSGQTRGRWYLSMNLIFEDTRFNGSMIQVMGTIPEDGEWAILGGTGEFVAAQGVVDHKVIKEDNSERIYEITVRGFYVPVDSAEAPGENSCNANWKLSASHARAHAEMQSSLLAGNKH
ncbi:hypothetical protein GUJ93_ZPchr0008g13244 [Zizania palustris]|uniref:Dirigent protein n=1 Tax=Zizania palustris TaxID=103762 RepID=A0A8J5QWX3_ZIZPA|nr:hypothetical protein GUJ93_ZPchr0008g13244 [Zizania palustris]